MAEQLSLLLSQGWLKPEEVQLSEQLSEVDVNKPEHTADVLRQCVFIRLPKNASTSVLHSLRQHLRLNLTIGGHNECLSLCAESVQKVRALKALCKPNQLNSKPLDETESTPLTIGDATAQGESLDTSHLSSLASAVQCGLGREAFNSAFKFAFVRNPYDRCVSSWKYCRASMPFGAFVEMLAEHGLHSAVWSWHDRVHICAQLPHLMIADADVEGESAADGETSATGRVGGGGGGGGGGGDGASINVKLAVDYVGRFEELEEGMSHVLNALGQEHSNDDVAVAHLNKQERGNYKAYYTTGRCRKLVYQVYKRDIDYFGYEF